MFKQISILRSVKHLQLMSHSQQTITTTVMKNRKILFYKEKLPTPTAVETVTLRDRDLETLVQTHLSSRKVKYGDYDFFECNEGYILCYVNAYQRKKEPQNVFYGVFYGEDHPLNLRGPVEGIQTWLHGQDNAILNAIRKFPKIEAKQLCICTDCVLTITMIPEKGSVRVSTSEILDRKDAYEQLTAVARLRDDLKLRIMYAPSDVIYRMKRAKWLASIAEMELRPGTFNQFSYQSFFDNGSDSTRNVVSGLSTADKFKRRPGTNGERPNFDSSRTDGISDKVEKPNRTGSKLRVDIKKLFDE